jgi:hypothetical protein
VLDVQSFKGVGSDTDHCLVGVGVGGREALINGAFQKLDTERFNLQKLNGAKVKVQYQIQI